MADIKPPFVIPVVEGWQGWTVLGLIGFMLIALVAELAPPYLVMMGTLIIFLALSILDVDSALRGFADEAMLSVAVLFVVARGIEQSGGLEYVASVLFRTPDKSKEIGPNNVTSKTKGSIVWVLLKFSVPVAIFSAFLANIPLVAMMIPPIVEFGKKVNLPPSKMLMPLSYAAQLGGTMTLIGAGTNLVVLSMAAQKLPDMKMNIFEIGIIGVPVTIAGIFYIVAFSGKLLPDRLALQPTSINAREYNVVLVMKQGSSMARRSVDQSGIKRQPGLTLLAVDREEGTTQDPPNDFVFLPKDTLHFVGTIDSVLLLTQLQGLALTEDEGREQIDLNRLKVTQCLVEAVVASGSPMVNKRIADLQFRERYNAAIVAIHRYGTRLSSAIGDIKVQAGDCLLMVADGSEFVTKHRNNSTFALVAQLPGFKPLNRKKAVIAAILVFGMVVASGIGMKLITAALFSSAGLLITKCLTPRDAMESIELPVLIMIAAAFGIAEGMVESGAATLLAKALMGLAGKSLFGLISITYIATTFFSLAITNNAAVTIMFPVALAAANQQMLDFRPFAYILMMGASAGFMTPTGCPTNLMVYTPGGYKFSDFIYYGGPMQILLLIVTVGVTMTAQYWWIWWGGITLFTMISIPFIARHKSTHPRPMPAAPTEVKSSSADPDAENPAVALNEGGEDSSSYTLTRSVSQDVGEEDFSRESSIFPVSSFAGLSPTSQAASAPVLTTVTVNSSRHSSSSHPLSSFPETPLPTASTSSFMPSSSKVMSTSTTGSPSLPIDTAWDEFSLRTPTPTSTSSSFLIARSSEMSSAASTSTPPPWAIQTLEVPVNPFQDSFRPVNPENSDLPMPSPFISSSSYEAFHELPTSSILKEMGTPSQGQSSEFRLVAPLSISVTTTPATPQTTKTELELSSSAYPLPRPFQRDLSRRQSKSNRPPSSSLFPPTSPGQSPMAVTQVGRSPSISLFPPTSVFPAFGNSKDLDMDSFTDVAISNTSSTTSSNYDVSPGGYSARVPSQTPFNGPPAQTRARRLTPPPWEMVASSRELPSNRPPQVEPSRAPEVAPVDTSKNLKRVVEEDITGGIHSLMNTRRLSSMKDVDAFADLWTTTP